MPGENLPGERIESLVDELEGIIEEARPPLGRGAQSKVIETDVVFNILDEIRMSYPEAEGSPHPEGARRAARKRCRPG